MFKGPPDQGVKLIARIQKVFWYIRYTIQVVNKVSLIKDLKALYLRGPTQENLLPHPLAVPSLDNWLFLRLVIIIKHARGFLKSSSLNWQLISWNSKAKFCKHHFCSKNLVVKTVPVGVGVGLNSHSVSYGSCDATSVAISYLISIIQSCCAKSSSTLNANKSTTDQLKASFWGFFKT